MICEPCVKKHEFLLYYDESCMKRSQVTEEDKSENADHSNQEEASGDKEDMGDCKKPNEKSDKICAKFWSDVCNVSFKFKNKICIMHYFQLSLKINSLIECFYTSISRSIGARNSAPATSV